MECVGAFYAHFASKEDLVANVLADQLRTQRQTLEAEAPDRAGLEAFVRSYLSPQHRDDSADGCPSAALLDEIVRRSPATGQVFTEQLMGVIDDIAARGPGGRRRRSDERAHRLRTAVGTLQLARALTDRDVSDQLLARSAETALKLLDDRA
jgi:AcrR family transcriptional regulator